MLTQRVLVYFQNHGYVRLLDADARHCLNHLALLISGLEGWTPAFAISLLLVHSLPH